MATAGPGWAKMSWAGWSSLMAGNGERENFHRSALAPFAARSRRWISTAISATCSAKAKP